jgi:mRNA interferase RelE/StbE
VTHRVEISRAAEKAIVALDGTMQKRVRNALRELAETPRPDGCVKMKGDFAGRYRIRVGTVRVVYSVDDGALVVLVVMVEKRGDIYWSGSVRRIRLQRSALETPCRRSRSERRIARARPGRRTWLSRGGERE